MSAHRTIVIVAILAIVASTSAAHAEPVGAQAEVLFRQGRELMAAGKIAEACATLAESQKLEPAVATLLNLAGCRELNGQLATAWGLFLDAERQTRAGRDGGTQKLHDTAKARADLLELRVSKLTINVPDLSKLDGLEITRDGEHVDTVLWNRALPVDGGTYTITARAPGANDWSTKIAVATDADIKTVEIPDLRNLARDLGDKPRSTPVTVPASVPVTVPTDAPVDGPTDAPVDGPVSPPATHHARWLPIAVGGGAVVLGGIALGLELDAESTYNKAKAELASQSRRDSLYDSANTRRFGAYGFAAGGVVCAGAAVWLYLRGRHVDDERTAVVVTPTGLAVAGRF